VITEIEIEGFKSFEKARLKLGGLNLFIGANASGKSNFFDALRVLQGLGYGFSVSEIFDGKSKSATSEVWEGIRGGSRLASYQRRDHIRFSVAGTRGGESFHYQIEMAPESGKILVERIQLGTGETLQGVARSDPSRSSVLVKDQLGRHEAASRFVQGLGNMQEVDPWPSTLRQYSQSSIVSRMGDHGESFATVVKAVLRDESRKSAYLSWLRQLTPFELDDVEILEGALGESLFALVERGRVTPAPILSDGTLCFAAITAAFFQQDMPDIVKIEEIENGIHPSRLRLLLELLRSQSRGSGPQVFATTHSPVVLAWLDEKDFETTFLFKRDEDTGASTVTPLSEIPHLIDLVRKQPIGELFTEGWLEGAF
jgi:predicted ATPase